LKLGSSDVSLALQTGKKRANDEKEYQQAFTSRLKKIKSRRKHFRQMLFDAYSERKKLIESMSLQKHEEEVLRRKVRNDLSCIIRYVLLITFTVATDLFS